MKNIEEVIKEFSLQRERMKKEGYTEPPVKCRICKDKGFIDRRDEKGYVYSRMCECRIKQREKERTMRLIEASGLKGKFERCMFDNYQTPEPFQKQLLDLCKKYTEETESKWLLLSGQSGCGKTHLCTAVCGQLIKRGCSVRYLAWRDDGAKIKRNANNDEAYTALTEPYKQCDVLYIDDLFKGGMTEADINLAFEILNHRYDRQLRTIISAELPMVKLKELDEAIAGRINEMCGEYQVFVNKGDGRNWRDRL